MFSARKILHAVGVIVVLGISIGIGWLARNASTPPAPLYPSKVEQGEQTAAAANANRPDETNTTPSSVSPSAPTTHQSPPQPLRREDLPAPSTARQAGAALPRGYGGEGGEEEVRVVRVVDGDTIQVEINGKIERVRYIGIDTPETVDPVRGKSSKATAETSFRTSNGVNPRKTVQCFGVEASKKNKELVEGKMVRLEKDITDRDKYNRLLRYIWLGDTLINHELVAQGFAQSYSYPPDVKYQDRFVAAEKKARADKVGLWTACRES